MPVRASQYYAPTLRQVSADAEVPSHRLLLRGGFIRPLSAGAFNFLPMGLRVLRNVERIIREEMNAAGAHEVVMPILHPRDLWERSGRWETFRPEPLKTHDRAEREFCLAPTHEEVITDLVRMDVTSYRELPVTLYQIGAKFRDELRPRGGLIRCREFLMKDAYSFDTDLEGLDRSYNAMFDAYCRLFSRMKLPMLIVEADAGSMGGFGTKEFMLPTPSGEDTVITCDGCEYRSNLECAVSRVAPAHVADDADKQPQMVETPGATTIEAVCTMLDTAPHQLVKTLIYNIDGRFVAACVRGDRQLNEFKLARETQAVELRMATPAEILEVTGAPVGFSGPVGLSDNVQILCDEEIAAMSNFVVGANREDAHLVGVNTTVDFTPTRYCDLREAEIGDRCAMCDEGTLKGTRGIELGHVFKLGTKYSEALECTFTDEDGKHNPAIMGCYGIGVSRCIAAIVEHHHDDNGIIWPLSVAPFHVAVLLLDPKIPELASLAEELYGQLAAEGFEVLLDDRDDRPGSKFKDADLIGYPLQVVVGKKAANEGLVEVRRRCDKEERIVAVADVVQAVRELAEGA